MSSVLETGRVNTYKDKFYVSNISEKNGVERTFSS